MTAAGRRTRLGVIAVALIAVLGLGAVVMMRPGPLGTVTGTERPAGGISQQRAIEIATATSIAPGPVVAGASDMYDVRFGRWVWFVSWSYSAGPTSAEHCRVIVDYQTGEILDRQCAVA